MDSNITTTVAFNETPSHQSKVAVFKKRMLTWDSPVEYVNNMYGCHPNEAKEEYFDKIYERTGT